MNDRQGPDNEWDSGTVVHRLQLGRTLAWPVQYLPYANKNKSRYNL